MPTIRRPATPTAGKQTGKGTGKQTGKQRTRAPALPDQLSPWQTARLTRAPGKDELGTWIRRVGAAGIDLLVVGVPGTIAAYLNIQAILPGDPAGIIPLVLTLASVGLFVWNVCLRQGRRGSTLGKQLLGLRLVRESDGRPVGPGLAFVRAGCHFFDVLACFSGYLWPLWDEKRQTFADKIVSTLVMRV
jgi:uncharacterized RDD family membrane protein YckC